MYIHVCKLCQQGSIVFVNKPDINLIHKNKKFKIYIDKYTYITQQQLVYIPLNHVIGSKSVFYDKYNETLANYFNYSTPLKFVL